jgi:hypothetical protein
MDKPEEPKKTIILPGTVQKIIPPSVAGDAEKAEISVEPAEPLYQEIRVENTLKDEKTGEEVALKAGAKVDVTIEATADATVPKKPSSKVG